MGIGRCYVVLNGIRFQDSAELESEPVRIALPTFYTHLSGRWLETPSGIGSLTKVRFDTWQETRDSMQVMLAVSFDLEDWKERVTGWIKRYQNQALACLRKSDPFSEILSGNDKMTANQAERMARQLRELIHMEWAGAK